MAATAEVDGPTVPHDDAGFDPIADVTGPPTEWVAPAGAI